MAIRKKFDLTLPKGNISNKISRQYKNILGDFRDLSIEDMIDSIISYYESIIGCMPGNVYWLDKNAVTVGCNQNVLKMFGFKSIDEFKGLTFEQMGQIANWSPESTRSFKADTLQVINTGKEILNIEEPSIPNINGKKIYFLTSRVPLFDDYGTVIGVVGISVDITKHKKLEVELKEAKEKAEVANETKTHFLENMRHDIRTPLSAIVGFAELLKDIKDGSQIDKYREYAVGLSESSRELLKFLNNVLESINVASGEIPILKNKFDLSTILSNVIKLHQPIALSKNLKIVLNVDKLIPKYLIGDSVRIYRIVLELLVNALKFTQKGLVKISANLIKKDGYDLVIMIEVEDTGHGISIEKQEELLVRFKRLTPSFQGIYKGTGLGLSIVKQFIDDLQGEVYIESNNNQGSKFICLLPIKESLLDSAMGEVTYNEVTEEKYFNNLFATKEQNNFIKKNINENHNGLKILIVEDHELTAKVERNIFNNLGCQVDIALDGESALQMYKENQYDLILMDIGLPGMSGYDTVDEIRQYEKTLGYSNKPIIGLTAHISEDKKQQSKKTGMTAMINKPLLQETAAILLKQIL